MKKSELKEMIKAAFLAEKADGDVVDPYMAEGEEDLDELLARLSEVEVDMPKINIPAIASKIEGSSKIDVIASKVQNNPKAMDALNKLASMYGLDQMNELDSSDFSSIEMAAKEFASTLQEMDDNDDTSLTAAGVLGGPLLLAIPGLMEFIQQAIPAVDNAAGDSLIFLASIVAGVAIGNILDRVKNANESVNEAEEEDVKVKVKVDAEDLGDEIDAEDTDLSADDEEVKTANDSIVVDKKIVSLSSLPNATRKILDTLETLRAEAEEFGDQKFITQVGNTITFFTRDFVVAGDAPNPQGIEEGDGGLDLDIDNPAKETEMEAGLGLEEEVNELFGLFGSKVGKVKKREMALIDKAVDSFSNYSPNTVNKDDIYGWQRELQSMIQNLKSMEDEEYAKRRLNMNGGRDNFLKQWVMSKGGTVTDYTRQVRSDVINGMNNDGPTYDNAGMYIQSDEMEDFKKAAGMNESLFPMWNKIK